VIRYSLAAEETVTKCAEKAPSPFYFAVWFVTLTSSSLISDTEQDPDLGVRDNSIRTRPTENMDRTPYLGSGRDIDE
jgi:hypothetical protein